MNGDVALVFRATQGTLAALPASHVMETMRPLACEPIAGAPSFVVGAAVIRGIPTPIVDVGVLLGAVPAEGARRWITLRVGARVVGLAVADVMGMRRLPAESAAPPLLSRAAQGATRALSVLDGELLVLLSAASLIGDDVWRSIERDGGRGAR
ncbi:MAG TPA: chemotaxis protein CheW [Labilithrix sp.]|nr:chemotaxis protein CheW [Labilithrix sp.]